MSQNKEQNQEANKAEETQTQNQEANKAEEVNEGETLEELKAKLAEEQKAREEAEAKLKNKKSTAKKEETKKEETKKFVTKSKEQRQMEQVDEIDAMKQAQLNGDIEMIAGNKDKDYEFSALEKQLIHLRCSVFITRPGQKENDRKDRVLKFAPLDFEAKERRNAFAEFDEVSILHDPRGDQSISKHRQKVQELIKDKSNNLKKVIE